MGNRKHVAIWYWPGINCEEEVIATFNHLGASAEIVFIDDLISGKKKVTDCDIVFWAGGFSFGDHIDTGIIAATLVKDIIPEFLESGIPGMFVCNGFQIGMRAKIFGENIALTRNDSGVFCSKPVDHKVLPSNCLWTKNLENQILSFPSAHIGGKLVGETENVNIVMNYKGFSPNGGNIAAICNDRGNLLGIMDHPERPFGNKDGLKIFQNGLNAV